ncbi:YmfQ family protein [Endozoicomonas acroporae]|uniref:YmfQ family protein n=1 Tax=Endozoicomonas acroporae TaxID=1701104 RepID=UPI0013D8C89B|nr:putative phage tail protein [Endozoicomonas acroporae]
MAIDSAGYTRQLLALAPQGLAWPRDPGSRFVKTMRAYADSLARLDKRADDLINELDPRTTYELLPEWERCFGLPDGCSTQGQTLEERQQQVHNRFVGKWGQSRAFFISIAASLGYTITIDEFVPFRCGLMQLGIDELNHEDSAFCWRVNIRISDNAREFHTGISELGERLTDFRLAAALECLFRRLKPAYTIVVFNYA